MNETVKLFYNSNIAKESSETRIAFYINIGFFIELAQMLEFNLRKLLCFKLSVKEIEDGDITKERIEEICKEYDSFYSGTYNEKWTLGKLKDEVKNEKILSDEKCKKLKEANDYRVAIVHKIFQENIVTDKLSSAKAVEKINKKSLIPMIDKTDSLNKFVIEQIEEYKEKLHKYKRQVGIEIN